VRVSWSSSVQGNVVPVRTQAEVRTLLFQIFEYEIRGIDG